MCRHQCLQLATPTAVFLLDMLTLCGDRQGNGVVGGSLACSADDSGIAAGSSSSISSSGTAGDSGTAGSPGGIPGTVTASTGIQPTQREGSSGEDDALPPLQARLSALLLRLFGDGSIIKAGFGLQTDVARLCESYPWLPCFGSEGPVPLR